MKKDLQSLSEMWEVQGLEKKEETAFFEIQSDEIEMKEQAYSPKRIGVYAHEEIELPDKVWDYNEIVQK